MPDASQPGTTQSNIGPPVMSLEHVAVALTDAAWKCHFSARSGSQSASPSVEHQLIDRRLSVGTRVTLYGAPDCVVVDCVPWTCGAVTTETLVVLLPPHQLPTTEEGSDRHQPHRCAAKTAAAMSDGCDGVDDGMGLLAYLMPMSDDTGHGGALGNENERCDHDAAQKHRSMSAVVEPDVLLELGVCDGALVSIGGSVYFELREAPTSCDGTMARTGGSRSNTTFACTRPLWLALNNWHRSVAPLALPAQRHQHKGSWGWDPVILPLNAVVPVWRSDVAPLPPNVDDAVVCMRPGTAPLAPSDDTVMKLMTVKKVLLVPAMHAQWMASVFGPKHVELLEGLLKAAILSGWLHNHIVFEDAVLSIPLNVLVPSTGDNAGTTSSPASSTWAEWLQRCESCSATAHATAKQCEMQYFPYRQLLAHGVPMRVALVATDSALAVGMIRTTAADAPSPPVLTEVLLGASSGNTTLLRDEARLSAAASRVPVPLFRVDAGAPAYPYLVHTRGTASMTAALNRCIATHGTMLSSHPTSPTNRSSPCRVVVAFGRCDNLVFEQTRTALDCCGLQALVHDMRASADWKVVVDMAEALALEPAPQVLVVRHAQRALTGANFHLLSALAHGEADAGATTSAAAGIPVYPLAIVLLVETNDAQCPVSLSALSALPPVRIAVPGDEDREAVMRAILTPPLGASGSWRLSRFLSFTTLQQWTIGLPLADVVAYAQTSLSSLLQDNDGGRNNDGALPVLGSIRLEDALKQFQKVHGHSLASTKLQPVRWSDVGGLEEAKKEIMETIQLPILHPELFANGTKRRAGILLYGPPGCGKTLIAKAVATELNINFISVKGPELINQYVGESERNVRNLFQRARDSAPCIVFFDELDALVPARGAKGDAGGAMDRIVAQLLVEVDGVGASGSDDADDDSGAQGGNGGGKHKEIFIIGATNRPDLLDPALLRPGRFDRLCYLGLPSTKDEQLFAIRALTRKFALSSDVDLAEVVRPLDFVFTGADFFALCSDAMMLAVDDVVERAKSLIEAQPGGDDADADGINDAALPDSIEVSQRHFISARSSLKASVTQHDLRRYEALKSTFNKR